MYIHDISKFRARIDTIFEDNEQMYDDIIALISAMPSGETLDTWGDDKVANLIVDYPTLKDDWERVKRVLKDFYYNSITVWIEEIEWDDDGEGEDLPDLITLKDKEVPTTIYEYLNDLDEDAVVNYLSDTYGFCVKSCECTCNYV